MNRKRLHRPMARSRTLMELNRNRRFDHSLAHALLRGDVCQALLLEPPQAIGILPPFEGVVEFEPHQAFRVSFRPNMLSRAAVSRSSIISALLVTPERGICTVEAGNRSRLPAVAARPQGSASEACGAMGQGFAQGTSAQPGLAQHGERLPKQELARLLADEGQAGFQLVTGVVGLAALLEQPPRFERPIPIHRPSPRVRRICRLRLVVGQRVVGPPEDPQAGCRCSCKAARALLVALALADGQARGVESPGFSVVAVRW
ncbi:MAG: hypothetical protein IPF41_17325 [Flavobacteriales bacterium]|nr:hypothetical protein [Flavobacteriales bacterium]